MYQDIVQSKLNDDKEEIRYFSIKFNVITTIFHKINNNKSILHNLN